MITTKRMTLSALSKEEMQLKIAQEHDPEMKQAYAEMLDGCIKHPQQALWYTAWNMYLKDEKKTLVGDLCFKGLEENGSVEIGYGIAKAHEGRGLTTEAVIALTQWAMQQSGVSRIEAETDPDNLASQKVLQKAGFLPSGVIGKEGPRFVLKAMKH